MYSSTQFMKFNLYAHSDGYGIVVELQFYQNSMSSIEISFWQFYVPFRRA